MRVLLALLIPVALFVVYRQSVRMEQRAVLREIDDSDWHRARRATEVRR